MLSTEVSIPSLAKPMQSVFGHFPPVSRVITGEPINAMYHLGFAKRKEKVAC